MWGEKNVKNGKQVSARVCAKNGSNSSNMGQYTTT